jgi:hypothetical protein
VGDDVFFYFSSYRRNQLYILRHASAGMRLTINITGRVGLTAVAADANHTVTPVTAPKSQCDSQ